MCSRLLIFGLMLSLVGGLRADLVGYWPLDGNAADASGNGNAGTISGNVTPTADRFGDPGGAMAFGGGAGDYISVGDAPEFNLTGAMTLTAWVLLKGDNANNGRIVAKAGGGGQRSWGLNVELNVGGISNPATFQVARDGSNNLSVRDTVPLPTDEWVHVAGVYRLGQAMEVYVDGELRNTNATDIPAQQFSSNGLPVLIGNRHGASNCGWRGALDEVRIYNEALSQGQIQGLMGVSTASHPLPADGAQGVDPKGLLSWDAPPSATCDVYLGTDPDFAGEAPVSADQSGDSYDPSPDLQFAAVYYWRVDVKSGGQTYEGPLWSFTTQGLASDPVPADGATRVGSAGTILSWTGDDAAVSYDVYLGTDQSVVASARRPTANIDGAGPVDLKDLKVLCQQWLTCPSGAPNANLDGLGNVGLGDYGMLADDWRGPFRGNQTSTTFVAGALAADTTYFWRADEVNDSEPTSPWKGKVWNFTTTPGARLWEYGEWALSNPSWSGNPFDVIATVTFTHTRTGRTHTTEMFYDGGNTWKFRFTGTETGQWQFATSSADPELDGQEGVVVVAPNPDARKAGFVVAQGQKWTRSTGGAFVPQFVMYNSVNEFAGRPEKIDADIETFLVGHGFTGFHTCVECRWFNIAHERSDEISTPNPDPDVRTFAALEMLIDKTYAAGGTVHIWAWGDESRRLTPVKWGINGPVDRRLQRYIAARLGPLPGWTMGYGFDLWEWVTGPQLAVWHGYVHSHFGWPHLLGARSEKNQLTQLCETLDYSSYEQHRPDYAMYVLTIEARPGKPSFSEDRFRIRPDSPYPEKDYDTEMTRRGLWHSTMAGGVANIWGNLETGSNASVAYPNAEQIKCWSRFFAGRFLPDMARDNALTDGVCLRSPSTGSCVFYKEDTASLQMDLSGLAASSPAVAVDTKRDYAEIDLGMLNPADQTWTAPYASDWAIAVGDDE